MFSMYKQFELKGQLAPYSDFILLTFYLETLSMETQCFYTVLLDSNTSS